MLDVTQWFSSKRGGPESAVREIFHHCLDALEARDFEPIRLLMADMVPHLAEYDVSVLLAPLSITVPCRDRVPGRVAYYNAVKAELELREFPERVGVLLQGLE